MKIDVYYTPLGLNAGDLTGRAVVVIDVLRATSTIVSALAAGAKAIVPAASSEEVVRLTSNLEKNGIVPKDKFDLSSLDSVTVAGSPVSPECQAWFYENVKKDCWTVPGCGGTDICSGFVGGVVTLTCSGKHCPFKTKSFKRAKHSSTIDVVQKLKASQRRFRAGQTLDVSVAAPNRNAKVLRFKLRSGKTPTGGHYCIPLGTKKVQRTC